MSLNEESQFTDKGTVSRTSKMQLKTDILKEEQKEKVYFIGLSAENNMLWYILGDLLLM